MSVVPQRAERAPAVPAGGGRTTAAFGPPWIAAVALVLAIVAVYQPTWDAQFIWDDDAHLTAHPSIVGPLGLKEVWTTSAANYFPLVLTTFWVVNKLFGLDPLVFHLLNVGLHIGCTLLLWAVLRRLRIRGAWLGAALWGLHPVQVESVAWVSEIINTQSGLFFLLAIWFGSRWLAPEPEADRRPADYWIAFVCALAAMLSKPSTVMLPVVLALCCWWLRGRLRWRDAAWLAPFFVIALATSGWAIWEQKVHSGAAGAEWNLSLADRVIIAGRAVWFYAGKLLWPHPLSFIYPRWSIDSTALWAWLAPLTAALGVGLVAWRAWKKGGLWRGVFFAVAYHVVQLFPVLGFFDVYFFKFSFVADHFQYLAGMGGLALAGSAFAAAWSACSSPRIRVSIAAAVTCSLLLLTVLGWRHTRKFRDDETLWRATLRTNPSAMLAHNNLGVILADRGEYEKAAEHYRQGIALNPNQGEGYYSLAQALTKLPGREAEARQNLATAIRLNPKLAAAHSAYATLLARMPGRRDEAIRHFEAALQLRPDHAEDHSNLGLLLAALPGRLEDAVAHGRAAVKLKPKSAEAHFNLANHLSARPQWLEDAIHHYQKALQIKPDYVKAHINLGLVYARVPDRLPEAIRSYEAALEIDPKSAMTHNNLAIALVQSGRMADARTHFEQAVAIDPNYADARNNLKRLLEQIGEPGMR